MRHAKRLASIGIAWWFALLLCATIIGAAAWGFSGGMCTVTAHADREFHLNEDMDTFRQILVRSNSTEAILNHSGMKLLEESTEAVDIDLSKDAKPLRNFLRGKSKANVTATKHLKVQLNDPELAATELVLRQDCHIEPENIQIVTTSDRPAGELKMYSTSLDAIRNEKGTDVKLTIDMTVEVKVSYLFRSQARYRVQQAAIKSLEEQEVALRKLAENTTVGPMIRVRR